MARWSEQIGRVIRLAGEDSSEHILDTFFTRRNYLPQTEEEKREFEEFSLISSSMALMIHIAKADKIMHPEERTRIIEDLTFQLEQRPFEYERLTENFGSADREIIGNLYSKMLIDYEKGNLDLDKTIASLNLIYQNNPEKRYYIIRLCYYCALSDSYFDESEETVIKDIARQLKVPVKELKRIEKEVKRELKEDL